MMILTQSNKVVKGVNLRNESGIGMFIYSFYMSHIKMLVITTHDTALRLIRLKINLTR